MNRKNPMPNWHSIRVLPPRPGARYGYMRDLFGDGIDAVVMSGEKPGPLGGRMRIQAVRFRKDRYTPQQVRAWMKRHPRLRGKIEPARKNPGPELSEALASARRHVKNAVFQAYADSYDLADRMYGWTGARVQLIYLLENMKEWKGEEARRVKDILRRYVKMKVRPNRRAKTSLRGNPVPMRRFRHNPAGPSDAEILEAIRYIDRNIPKSWMPKNSYWPAQAVDVATAWKRAQGRKNWIRAHLAHMQSGVPARNMIRALSIMTWENTVDDWQRLFEAQMTAQMRRRPRGTRRNRKNPSASTPALKHSRRRVMSGPSTLLIPTSRGVSGVKAIRYVDLVFEGKGYAITVNAVVHRGVFDRRFTVSEVSTRRALGYGVTSEKALKEAEQSMIRFLDRFGPEELKRTIERYR